ncbi:MAG: Gfo/Idh/MocA family oxidoreductase [candidate division WOR-3 bacterium]|nr:MAG: Gfo/Idh/MocA family oxidoreductase [candidate division WOR-3 bacterium]
MKVAVVGLGRWGPRLVTKLRSHVMVDAIYGYDSDTSVQVRMGGELHDVIIESNYRQIIENPEIGAVIIATPVATHFDLARQALEHDKHVLLEKPLTSSMEDARALVKLAASRDLRLMVDHITVYSGVARKLKELIMNDELGKILYFDAVRSNLGMLQYDVNVVWDLAIHEFAMLDYLLGEVPAAVTGVGSAHHGSQEEIAHATLFYRNGVVAHVHVSWISPIRIRRMVIGGTKNMIVFDDTLDAEKVKLYDSGVDVSTGHEAQRQDVTYRAIGCRTVEYTSSEPMLAMLDEFFRSITDHRDPLTDGLAGMRMVGILSAVEKSMRERGATISLD